MHALQDTLEREWTEAIDPKLKKLVASIGTYSIIAFCGSFRGCKVFLVDSHGLRKYLAELKAPEKNYVIIPLLGRFKGETGDRYHLTPLAAETLSGLHVRDWIKCLVFIRETEGRLRGPAFCGEDGEIATTKHYELAIMDRLVSIQEKYDHLIPKEMDVYEEFGVSRSFWRGATSAARVRGVSDRQIDLIDHWRLFESARGKRPQLSMQDHYSDIQILIPELTMFSRAL
jgi:hypothetical protein